MELRHLRYFAAVAEALNFTRAAEKLRLAQPSLTRQIQNLEDEIGVRLVDRSKKRVVLTEEGTSFLIDARRVLALAEESIQAVQRLSRGETGELNIGYLANFNFDLLPKTLEAFRQLSPHIALNLLEMTPTEQLQALEAQKIDVGFVGLRFSAAAGDLQWECLARHKTVVALPSKHPLTKRSRLGLSDLKTLFFVGMSEKTNPGFRDWLNEICKPAGFTPRILQDADLEPGLMRFVAEGLGVTLAREQIKNLPHPGVIFRPLSPPVHVGYWIAWKRDNASKALRQYIETVKKLAGRGE